MPVDPISIAAGAVQLGAGLIGSGKAKRQAGQLAATRPKLKASPFTKDNLSLAESELQQGMGAEAERAYTEGLDRDLSSSLNTILMGGGSVNNVAEVFDRSATGRQRLALMEDNLRLNQINQLVNARGAAENERQTMFEFNDWRPWADAAQSNAAARKQSSDLIWGGIDTIGGGLMKGLAGNRGQKDLDNYFNFNPESGLNNPMARSQMSTVDMTAPIQTPNPGFINPNYASSLF